MWSFAYRREVPLAFGIRTLLNATAAVKTWPMNKRGIVPTIHNIKLLIQDPDLAAAYRKIDLLPDDSGDSSNNFHCDQVTKHSAAIVIAKHHCRKIIDKAVSPYAGVKSIVTDACDPLRDCPKELGVFITLECEYADLSADARRASYGEEHCACLRRQLERRIVEEANALVAGLA